MTVLRCIACIIVLAVVAAAGFILLIHQELQRIF